MTCELICNHAVCDFIVGSASSMRGNVFVKLANTGEIRSEYENELRKVSGYMFFYKIHPLPSYGN